MAPLQSRRCANSQSLHRADMVLWHGGKLDLILQTEEGIYLIEKTVTTSFDFVLHLVAES